jgi:hypothetical protein
MAILAQATQPIQEDFGGIVQQGIGMVQQAQENARLKEEARHKKLLEFEDRYGIPEEKFQLEDTQFRTVNDVTTEALAQARDRYYDVYKALQQDPTNIDLKKRLGKIKNTVTQLGSTHQKFMALGEDYLAKIENDEISGVDEEDWREKLEAADEGRLAVTYDENDNMQILFYDKEGAIGDVMPYKSLLGSSLTKRVDVDDQVDAVVKTLGQDIETKSEGGYLVKRNIFGDRQKNTVSDWIDGQLGTDEASLQTNDVMADLLYQASNGTIKKKENFTEEERQNVKQWLINKVEGKVTQSVERQADPLALARERAATTPTKDTRRGADLIQVATSGNAPIVESDGGLTFTLGKPSAIDATKSDRAVNRIRYNPDNDSIVLEAQNRIKLKDVQEMEDIKKKKPKTLFEEIMGEDNKVQYYMIENVEISSSTATGMKEINTFANYNEMGNAANLKQILINKFNAGFDNPEDAAQFRKQRQDSTAAGAKKDKPFG